MAGATKAMIRIVSTFLVQPKASPVTATCRGAFQWGLIGAFAFFLSFGNFCSPLTQSKMQPPAWCLDVRERFRACSLMVEPPQVPVSQPGGSLRILFLALKTQAVFPLEEPVMCGNIRDIAKWLRGVTVEIFHQSINLRCCVFPPNPGR